ncbi:VOC family protein [Erythrobacter sp. W302b]|uniref:VOC family protein n=1 Tax=Erythrobacter sp. W302b TaxID=3389874 RepID=UPI00396B2E1C
MIMAPITAGGSPMIIGVKFISIPSKDQDRALKFYTEKLGFKLITDQPFSPEQRWIELRIGNSETRFVLFTPEGDAEKLGQMFSGALACDDVEATYRQLSERGVTFETPPTSQPWGTFAVMVDSEGNRFVLSSRH